MRSLKVNILVAVAFLAFFANSIGCVTSQAWPMTVTATGKPIPKLVQQAMSAVVKVNASVTTLKHDGSLRTVRLSGTGVIIDTNGPLVITAYQVISGTTVIYADIPGHPGEIMDVIKSDEGKDMAILRPKQPFKVWVMADIAPNDPERGEAVWLLGKSTGAIDTSMVPNAIPNRMLDWMLAVDYPGTPGDAGGLIVNESGQIYGLMSFTQLAVAPGDSATGYFVPVKMALQAVR